MAVGGIFQLSYFKLRNPMSLDGLRALLAVLDAGNFVRASEALGVPRATLRRRVDMLEADIGRPLLNRGRNEATATDAGRVLADGARRVLLDMSALMSAARSVGDEPAGVLRIGLPGGMPPEVLALVWTAFRARFPEVHVRARFFDDPRRRLLDDVDVAFHLGGEKVDGPWEKYHAGNIPERLMATPDYLERRGTPTSLAELDEHDILNLHMPGADPTVLPLLDGGSHPVEPVFSATDPRVLRDFANAGLGIALCALPPLPGLEPDKLVQVLPDVVGRERSMQMIVARALVETPPLRAIFRFARTMLGHEMTPS